jgi:hypothetical protein
MNFGFNPMDELNDLRMSEAAVPLLNKVRAFVSEVVNPMSEKFFALGEGRTDRWSYAPGQLELLDGAKAEAKRRGLMTQGAILKVTADGTSTSPVVRGVFVNERILGNHIPPPPPGIPAIEPDIRGATSIRNQLEKHRHNESCASCHQTIDPPGFALENYDPVGLWRKGYGKDSKGAKIDPSGVTPEGATFTDLATWQQIYTQQPQRLARGFATHFLTYATGAPPRFSDEAALDEIAKKTTNLRSIMREVVLSDIFRTK